MPNEFFEHHHRVLHVQNRYQISGKLTISHFWTKLAQKEYFQSKKMKIAIEFYIFELV